MMANVLGIKVDVPENEQGPSMGGAMLAAVGCGEYASVEEAAANRYYYNLVCAYREGLFEKLNAEDDEMQKAQTCIQELESSGISLSNRNKIDYRIMKTIPALYRSLYKKYNKIRKPNWDVK